MLDYPGSSFIKNIKEQEEKDNRTKNKRLKWDKSIMKCLKEFESHSHCAAKHVCCIIVREDVSHNYNILSIGLNGTPPGQPNCDEVWERYGELWLERKSGQYCDANSHSRWSSVNEIHAEVNAIAKCNKNCISTEGTYAFISFSPCMHCAKILVASGIKRIVFRERYDDFDQVNKFLVSSGIEVIQYYKD